MTPTLRELESRMRPGAYSVRGFLGHHESLLEVMESDSEMVREMGLTDEQLIDPLDALLSKELEAIVTEAEADLPFERERQVRRTSGFEVDIWISGGFQECPWSDLDHECTIGLGIKQNFNSLEWKITNRRTGETIRGPGLIVHLVRDHHFFEGKRSPYRVDPAALARVFELSTEKDAS